LKGLLFVSQILFVVVTSISAFDQLSLKSEEDQKARTALESELTKVLKQNEDFKRQLSMELSFKKV
jgi:DNA-directed RNA polymerase subunit L